MSSVAVAVTEEKLVRNMSYDGHMLLSSRLGPSCASGKNYKPLASMLGYTYEEVLDLERKEDPVMYLLKDRRFIDLTISRLKSCLLDMERLDVVEDLEPFEDTTLTPSEYERRHAERNRTEMVQAHQNLTVLPDDTKYDAFVCYARKDLAFAQEILRKLEADPYHLKLCISSRDILPGSHELSAFVDVIEQRCRKVIVIISKHFSEDIDADFQAKIALSLSPGCQKKKLIPIVCDSREFVPKILRHITHLDYTNMAAREYFWPNLARSLGYKK